VSSGVSAAVEVEAILAAASSAAEGPTGVLKAARRLAPLISGQPRVALLASFAGQLLEPYFVVEAARAGLPLRMWTAPFGQFEQLVLDTGSALWASAPDVLAVVLRLSDVDRRLVDEAPELGPAGVTARLAALRGRLVGLARELRARSAAPVLVANLALEGPVALFDASDPDGFGHLLAEHNRLLARELREVADAHVFDYAGTVAEVGAARFADAKLWAMARAVGSTEAHVAVARRLAGSARALLRPAHKCIVVDLDHTLWGGVLGDDGPAGLKLGDDGGGALYKDLQAALLGYRRRGMLLAVASKNDDAVAREALATHPEMLLRPEHFAVMEIGWGPKSDGLRAIAKALNIGVDALVFVDDSPVERAEVRAALPEVQVVELPTDPAGYLAALRRTPGLEAPRLLAEDRARAGMVAGDAARGTWSAQAGSVEDFLGSLEMVAEVGRVDEATLGRVHQLLHKTNQFNLTTRRHALEEVRRLGAADDAVVAWLRLADRFGDLGLVCVGIAKAVAGEAAGQAGLWEIDSLLMSCRVMGRQVEDAFLSYLAEQARGRGARRLRGLLVETAKNAPVRAFYDERGWLAVGDGAWERDIAAQGPAWPAVVKRKPEVEKEA